MALNHETGETIGDASSLPLLGLAIVGGLLTVCAYWLLGS